MISKIGYTHELTDINDKDYYAFNINNTIDLKLIGTLAHSKNVGVGIDIENKNYVTIGTDMLLGTSDNKKDEIDLDNLYFESSIIYDYIKQYYDYIKNPNNYEGITEFKIEYHIDVLYR